MSPTSSRRSAPASRRRPGQFCCKTFRMSGGANSRVKAEGFPKLVPVRAEPADLLPDEWLIGQGASLCDQGKGGLDVAEDEGHDVPRVLTEAPRLRGKSEGLVALPLPAQPSQLGEQGERPRDRLQLPAGSGQGEGSFRVGPRVGKAPHAGQDRGAELEQS